MFHFRKRDKGERKKEKDDKKRRDKSDARVTVEELRRLEEARVSMLGRTRKKEKLPSGITADYMANFTRAEREALVGRSGGVAGDLRQSMTHLSTDADIVALSSSPPPPRPPKRGVHRGGAEGYWEGSSAVGSGSHVSRLGSVRDGVMNYERLIERRNSETSSMLAAGATPTSGAGALGTSGRTTLGFPTSPASSLFNSSTQSVQQLAMRFESARQLASPGTSSNTNSMASQSAVPARQTAVNSRAPYGHSSSTPSSVSDSDSQRHLVMDGRDSSAVTSLCSNSTFAVGSVFPGVDLRLPPLIGGHIGAVYRDLTVNRGSDGNWPFVIGVATDAFSQLFFRIDTARADVSLALLPGDRLVGVNGTDVTSLRLEHVLGLLSKASDPVSLKVLTAEELSEVVCCQRESDLSTTSLSSGVSATEPTSLFNSNLSLKVSGNSSLPKSPDGERVWLVHKDGFSMAFVLSDQNVPSSAGKQLVRLQSSSEVLEVDEDDLEKAGDAVDVLPGDLTRLRHLNESSALHVLRQRFGCRLAYTHAGAGTTLVVVNPVLAAGMAPITDRSQVRRLFEQCRADPTPPHVYATAQSVYRSALCQRRDQAVLVLGRSGAGKTHCSHQILHYLVAEGTAAPAGIGTGTGCRPLTVERLEAVWTLLEAFGNCRTVMNSNASRFVSVYSLQLEPSGQLNSGSLQLLMLERFRVVRRPEGESNFHIFHYLLAGCDDQLRQQLQLHGPLEPNSFVTPLPKDGERQCAVNRWLAIQGASATLQMKPAECEAMWSVLAAIYHLGAAGVCRVAGTVDQYQFASASAAARAAHLLGVGADELSRAVLTSDSASNLKRAVSGRQLPTPSASAAARSATASGSDGDGFDALEAFVAGLYAHLVTALVSLINRCISANVSHRHTNSVLVIDTPGLQNPADCGRQTGASLDDFCFNYVQERLQLLFHELTCTNLRDNYAREQIQLSSPVEVDCSSTLLTSASLVSALDQQPRELTADEDSSRQLPPAVSDSCERRGLLWLLHEAALQPDVTDADFLHAICNMHCSNGEGQVLTAGPGDTCLTVNHMSATNPVTYDVTGWVASARETAASRRSALLLLESRRECVSVLFVSARAALGVASLSGSVAGLDSGALLLLRSASMRRTFSASSVLTSRHSSRPLLAKQQLDGLMERLRRCCVRFVHCLLPQTGIDIGHQKPPCNPPTVDVPLLRSQFRGAQLLDTLRIYKQGYPEHMVFAEFYRLFILLVPPSVELPPKLSLHGDQKMALQQLLTQLELDPLCYRIGVTKIFLRPNVLAELECRRDERLRDSIVRFQSVCRGYLARKRFNKLKVQNMALECIQRNVRLYLAVRSWSWWRLMNKITPLLDVHRTEQQLRTATEELSKLRVRLDKCEETRDGYKQERDALEGKLGEMMGELQEERHTAAVATQRLQAEQVEKQQLQRQLSEAQSEFERMCMLNEQLETELLTQSVTDGGQSATDDQFDLDQDASAATYRRKWEFAVRELEFTKKRTQQQHDDDAEQLMAVRKQLERKLESAVEVADEQRQLVAQLKRKVARLSSEAGDQKVHLDEQVARNNVLERRQRKFDSDMQILEDKLKREKQSRERINQEKDQLQSEVYSLNNELAALRLEMGMCEEKVVALRRELDAVQSVDQLSEDETAQLRRARLELQRLCDERDQQLEDAAGQLSLLEQNKLRLEMCLQQARQQHRSELVQKDEDLEELRAALGKKVKALESQLEVDHDERSALVRDKHELERRVIALGECSLTTDSRQQEAVQRLRRQLKRTRALLADAQLQLERGCGEGSGGKAQLRQLRNQLEDAEFAAAAATRGRQAVETELQEVQLAAEEAQRSRADAEARATAASRQLAQLQNQLDEQDDELQEVMKKYKSCVAQLSSDQLTMSEQSSQLDQMTAEAAQLRQQLSEVSARCQQLAGESGARDDQRRMELRVRELESRLEFESAGKQRLERQATRLREEVQQSGQEAAQSRERELASSDQLKKLQRQLRDVREELAETKRHETDASQQLRALSKQLEHSEAEAVQNRSDLRLALKRIADLQNAIQGDVESEELSDSEDSLSDGDSAHDDDDLDSFLSARLPSSLLLSAPTAAVTSLENGSSALSPDSACSNNNSVDHCERSNGDTSSGAKDPPDRQQ